MKARPFIALLVLYGAPLLAQSPAPAVPSPAPIPVSAAAPAVPASTSSAPLELVAPRVAQTLSNEIGFSYSLPLDWKVVDTKPMLPVIKQEKTEIAASEAEKKSIACVQMGFLARNGSPASAIESIILPYTCMGQTFKDEDLPAVAFGMAEEMKKTFDMKDPVYGAYKLGKHSLWIERANGTFLARPETKRTVEVTCTLLKKGLVCWLAMLADQDALNTFEHGAVTLDGKEFSTLVPADAFSQKP